MKTLITFVSILLLVVEILDPSSPFVRVNPVENSYSVNLDAPAPDAPSAHHDHDERGVNLAAAHGGVVVAIKPPPVPSGSFPAPAPKTKVYRFLFTREIPRPPSRA